MQRLVVRMSRFVRKRRRGCAFSNSFRLHGQDAIAKTGDDADIMRHEDHSCAEIGRPLENWFENLCLHRDIERGGRLIRDEQLLSIGQVALI